MSADQTTAPADDRLAELATGFATNELGEDDLRELHGLISRHDDTGRNAAAMVWQTLGTTIDLRAVLSQRFQDEVGHKISNADDGGDDQHNFLGGVLGRLGFSRPRLTEVRAPTARFTRATKRWRWWLLAAAVLVATASWWFSRPVTALATVSELHGALTSEGVAVALNTNLDGAPLVLAGGGAATLDWPGATRLRMRGPARVVPRDDACSVLAGHVRLEATSPFRLGLPDGQLRLAAGATAVVDVADGRSSVASITGEVELVSGQLTIALEPGQAATGGGRTWPWEPTLVWQPTDDGLAAAGSPLAQVWAVELHLTPLSPDANARLVLRGFELGIWPDRFTTPGDHPTHALPGPPLRDRILRLSAPGDGRLYLSVDGIDERIDLGAAPPPDLRVVSGGYRIEPAALRTGPRAFDN